MRPQLVLVQQCQVSLLWHKGWPISPPQRLKGVRGQRGGRGVRKHRGRCQPAPRQALVQTVDELYHVHRVEAKVHEASVHGRRCVAATIAQAVNRLCDYSTHLLETAQLPQSHRGWPRGCVAVADTAAAAATAYRVLNQHAVALIRLVCRAVSRYQP